MQKGNGTLINNPHLEINLISAFPQKPPPPQNYNIFEAKTMCYLHRTHLHQRYNSQLYAAINDYHSPQSHLSVGSSRKCLMYKAALYLTWHISLPLKSAITLMTFQGLKSRMQGKNSKLPQNFKNKTNWVRAQRKPDSDMTSNRHCGRTFKTLLV